MKSRALSLGLAIINIIIISYLFVVIPLVAEGKQADMDHTGTQLPETMTSSTRVPITPVNPPTVGTMTKNPLLTPTIKSSLPLVQPVQGKITARSRETLVDKGDKLVISGTNSLSKTTFLSIRGPVMKDMETSLHNSQVSIQADNATTFTTSPVVDGTWKYTWDTESFVYSGGTYEIVASGYPFPSANLNDSQYATTGIIIRIPEKRIRPLIDDGDSSSDGGSADSI